LGAAGFPYGDDCGASVPRCAPGSVDDEHPANTTAAAATTAALRKVFCMSVPFQSWKGALDALEDS
jgi:hypothetical protein